MCETGQEPSLQGCRRTGENVSVPEIRQPPGNKRSSSNKLGSSRFPVCLPEGSGWGRVAFTALPAGEKRRGGSAAGPESRQGQQPRESCEARARGPRAGSCAPREALPRGTAPSLPGCWPLRRRGLPGLRWSCPLPETRPAPCKTAFIPRWGQQEGRKKFLDPKIIEIIVILK